MDKCTESLRLLIGDRIATVGIAAAGHADGILWDAKGAAEAHHYGARALDSGHAAKVSGAGHPLQQIFEQFALEDQVLAPGGTAPSLDVLLGRLEVLLL